MTAPLSSVERRVLGVLIEKSLAQPAYYPMSVNAVTVGCNQKNNRDPVMELDEESVWDTLEQLRQRGLVARAQLSGSRVDKFKHEVQQALNLAANQRAVLAELLLRGPQTVNELRTRCSRMTPFDSPEAVTETLDSLATRDPPLVRQCSRAPGQREVRFGHLLYPPGEEPAMPSGGPSAADEPHERTTPRGATDTPAAAGPSPALEALRAQIESLQAEVADLHEQIASLRRRLDAVGA